MSARLDDRARRAAAGLRQAVEDVPVRSLEPGTTRPRVLAGAVAGVMVGAAVLLTALWLARPGIVADERSEVPTTATSLPATTTTLPAAVASTSPPPIAPVPHEDTTPPALTITTPTDGSSSEAKLITFAGTTEPGARVFAGPYEAEVDGSGEWAIDLVLFVGENRARFVAVDAAGNEAEAYVTVTYVPQVPSTTSTTKEKEEVSEKAPFTAYFTWGEMAADPPYDEYYGTGVPGSQVFVASEYGSGSTVVEESGEWRLVVEFPGAPAFEAFPVKVYDSYGRKFVFEFTST